ncbi:MAG: Asp-tRNA(Asn)/Glu-tRNA(Gln) amidotransferase subunit GatA [Candidatus Marinimicrobia bacterium]|nr:Asp-tRNA(Asn)/Glu-tRNA(Gln) amidotransferase subunit GatA [Candidatus Neomarinimicrobiota bacterium]
MPVKLDSLTKRAESVVERVNQDNPYHAFLSVLPDVGDRALQIESKMQSQTSGSLGGLIVAVKDNISVRGIPTTCGSAILENYIPPYDATVVKKIVSADGLIIGKTNMDEFAMGSSTEHSAFGTVRNPVDETRVPGGSSGGSAAAVAGGLVDVALGSDTGGSIRQPAAFCGIAGIKPTYGRVSRYGLVAFASSLDQIGVFSKNIENAAKLLTVISGVDPDDSTSSNTPVPDYSAVLGKEIGGLRVGIPKEYLSEGLNDEIHRQIEKCIDFFRKSGAEIVPVSLPHTSYAIATYYIIATAEASSNLARYDGIRYGLSKRGGDLESVYRETRAEGFGDEVTRRIVLGTYVLSAGYYDAYYDKAQRVRRLIKEDFVKVFQQVDILFTPTTPTTAFPIGGKIEDPLAMYLSDVYTVPASLAGVPAISVPLGNASDNLPIGGQIIGNYFDEETILQVGHYIERNFSLI